MCPPADPRRVQRNQGRNLDVQVVESFGDEWSKFNQLALSDDDRAAMFESYFHIFPWDRTGSDSEGADIGCGSGRWAFYVSPRVGKLYCVEPSARALEVAKSALSRYANCQFLNCDIEQMPFADGSLDFAYSLGVLHHTPDPEAALLQCARKLKQGAPFLVYLYYALDNQPAWFRLLWKLSDALRRGISRLPKKGKHFIADLMALTVYWPLARGALLLEKLGVQVDSFPLSYYRRLGFYVLRTDALDRFGTRLEHRFTRQQVLEAMVRAGFRDIRFSSARPYWCCVGIKA